MPLLPTYLLLPEQKGEAWEPSKKQCSFGKRGALDVRVFPHFVVKHLKTWVLVLAVAASNGHQLLCKFSTQPLLRHAVHIPAYQAATSGQLNQTAGNWPQRFRGLQMRLWEETEAAENEVRWVAPTHRHTPHIHIHTHHTHTHTHTYADTHTYTHHTHTHTHSMDPQECHKDSRHTNYTIFTG